MSLTVLDPGFYTLAVDAGRPHARHLGVPLGGAADRAALAVGNALLGNPPTACALEITAAGPTLQADRPTACTLFGAPFVLGVVGRGPVPAGTTFNLQPGEVLKVGGTPAGVRAYLCVAGGFDFPVSVGGRSGWEPVSAGAVLPCRESVGRGRGLPFVGFPVPNELRALPGPQADWFFSAARFYAEPYEVTAASNRMGLRLRGEMLERRPRELPSEAVAPGAVQVTNDGQPVVLGVDGQTIGGYPKVAHVIRADLDGLARLRPGAAVRFKSVNEAEAAAAARARAAEVNEWLVRLAVTQ